MNNASSAITCVGWANWAFAFIRIERNRQNVGLRNKPRMLLKTKNEPIAH
jgi:hypothetical protein